MSSALKLNPFVPGTGKRKGRREHGVLLKTEEGPSLSAVSPTGEERRKGPVSGRQSLYRFVKKEIYGKKPLFFFDGYTTIALCFRQLVCSSDKGI